MLQVGAVGFSCALDMGDSTELITRIAGDMCAGRPPPAGAELTAARCHAVAENRYQKRRTQEMQ